MKIIRTAYLPPTGTLDSRVKATLSDDRRDDTPTITLSYHKMRSSLSIHHEDWLSLSTPVIFAAAVNALFIKHEVVCGAFDARAMIPVPTARGYDFVITDSRDTYINTGEMSGFFKALGWAL